MYVYKSVAEYKVFRWRHKAALWSREGRPLFRRVSRCVRSCWRSRVCTRFRSEGKRGPFVREVEKRDEKRFETELVPVTFWRYLREWVWVKNRTLQESFSRGEGRSIKAQTGYNLSSRNLIWDAGRIGLVVSHNSVNDGNHLPAGVAHRCHVGFPFIPFFLEIKLQRRIVKHRR